MSLTEFLFIVLASMIGCILATVACWLAIEFRRSCDRRRRFKSK